jgi:chloramphenicol-sensitive protein RarD
MNRLQTLIGQGPARPLRTPPEAAISSPASTDKSLGAGFIAGLAAYVLWGFLPILFKSIHGVDSVTIVAERTVFSLVFVGLLLLVTRRLPEISAALADAPTRRSMLFSALLLGSNWLIYVYAIESGQILETSFGYFINPLANVATGMLLLGERLNRLQVLAILIALVAIGIQAVGLNGVPIIALSIAGTFAAYGYFRKTAKVSSTTGLFVETLLITPLGLAYVAYTFIRDGGIGAHADPTTLGLLVLTGPATAVPLLLFAFAVQRLRMTTIGMLQYIAPSIAFLIAVFLYSEPLNPLRLLSFVIICLSLAVYTADSLLRRRAAVPEAA